MIELELVGVRVELPHNQPIVLLKETGGDRFLPIWIGTFEATSIAFALQGVESARPMTHDLMKDLLDALTATPQRIVVTELRDGTFYAEIQLRGPAGDTTVSSRPSDAIALAVRAGVAIYAEESVLEEAGILIDDDDDEPDTEVEKFKEFLDTVTPEDFAQ
jgi:uncharacterized protein